MAVETNTALVTPIRFLGSDGTNPGYITTAQALTLMGAGGAIAIDIIDPARDGNYGAWRAPWVGTLDTVKHKVRGGTTCTVQLKKNGSNMTGFSSGVAMSTSEGSVTVGDSFAIGDYLVPRLATTSGLSADGDGTKGATITLNVTRTAV